MPDTCWPVVSVLRSPDKCVSHCSDAPDRVLGAGITMVSKRIEVPALLEHTLRRESD